LFRFFSSRSASSQSSKSWPSEPPRLRYRRYASCAISSAEGPAWVVVDLSMAAGVALDVAARRGAVARRRLGDGAASEVFLAMGSTHISKPGIVASTAAWGRRHL